MATYISYHLVHAHLPAPPSIPNAIPELHVPTQQTFPTDLSLLSTPNHPEQAISFAHNSDANVLARLIHNGYTLELRGCSLEIQKAFPANDTGSDIIRVTFPQALRPLAEDSMVVSGRGQLYVFALGQDNTLYRLSFPLDQGSLQRGGRTIFTVDQDETWFEEWSLPEEVVAGCWGISTWTVVDEGTVVLGGMDGGIIRVNCDTPGQWSANHHRTSSRFRLPSLFSSVGYQEQVLSFAKYENDHVTLVYSLSRDRKLRIWNAQNGNLLRSIDVRASSSSSRELIVKGSDSASSSPGPSSRPEALDVPLLRIVEHPSPASQYSHLVIAYLTPEQSSPGAFCVYRAARTDSGAGELSFVDSRRCSNRSSGDQIRGFEVISPERSTASQGWRLWVTWDHDGVSVAESIRMDDLFAFTTQLRSAHTSILLSDWQETTQTGMEDFDPSYFDNQLASGPAEDDVYDNRDIPFVFCQHLFQPGRYSSLSLTTALDEYIDSLPIDRHYPEVTYNSAPLSGRFAAVIGCDVDMTDDPQTGAPESEAYRRSLRQKWLGVWARVRDLDKQARWPLGTTALGSTFAIMTRDGFALGIPDDQCSLVAKLGGEQDDREFLALPPSAVAHSYPSLAPLEARKRSLAVAAAGHHLSQILSAVASDQQNPLETFVEQVDAQLSVTSVLAPITSARRHWDDIIGPSLLDEDLMTVRIHLSECDDKIASINGALDLVDRPESLVSTRSENVAWSGWGNALLAANIQYAAANRFALARDILLIAIFVCTADDESEEQLDDTINQTLHRAFSTYKECRKLKWLSEQTAEGAQKNERADRSRSSARLVDSDGFDVEYSLVHALLVDSLGPLPADRPDLLLSTLEIVQSTHASPHEKAAISHAELAVKMLSIGLASAANQLSHLSCLDSGLAYVRARACLDLEGITESITYFKQAASGFADGSLENVLPSNVGSDLMDYYRHVTSLYEEKGIEDPIVTFGRLAIQHAPHGDLSTKDLWTKVFLASLSLGEYDNAYNTLTAVPFEDLRRDFLGQLISAMCEDRQIGKLTGYGFIGFQKEVEHILQFKAQHSDPLRTPNYYRVLYSWHIVRGDYRNAGQTMYHQAKRLGESTRNGASSADITTLQAQSYLAAINTLTLCDPVHAWVSLPIPKDAPVKPLKRRRMTSYIPEDEYSTGTSRVHLVTLSDIRAEYTMVLSRLQLYEHLPSILGPAAVDSSPSEIVGMFVQRNMFDEAQSAAAALEVDMSDYFVELTTRCVELSRLEGTSYGVSTVSASFLHTSPVTKNLRGPISILGLRYLQTALQRHDNTKTEWRYTDVVADTFFELNSDKNAGWQMPAWLVAGEMDRDPEGWVSRALKWGWVEEAIDWSADLLRRATPPELLPPQRANAAYTPVNLIDRVIAAAGEADENDNAAVQSKVKALRQSLVRRIAGLNRLRK